MTSIDDVRTVARWLARRAWSRAGAVAAVLGTASSRRALALTTRILLFAVGSVTIAGSVAVLLWNDLGPGPLDVFIGGVRERTGLALAPAVWLTVGTITVAAWLMGRRPGIGTIVSPFIIGSLMQAIVGVLERVDVPATLAMRYAIQFGAIGGIGVGAGALIVSGLGAGSGELLAAAASDRSGHTEPRVRMAFELSWLVAGVLLGGPIGVGTVLVALCIGPAVEAGYRLVDGAMSSVVQPITTPVPLGV